MRTFACRRMALVGIGNRLNGDDAFGPVLVRRLRGVPEWLLWDAGVTPEGDIGRIASLGPERVLLLDAARWGSAPGRIGLFRCCDIPFCGVSTHALPLSLFAELLADRCGRPVALLGVEPKATGVGSPISPEVEEALRTLEGLLRRLASEKPSAAFDRAAIPSEARGPMLG